MSKPELAGTRPIQVKAAAALALGTFPAPSASESRIGTAAAPEGPGRCGARGPSGRSRIDRGERGASVKGADSRRRALALGVTLVVALLLLPVAGRPRSHPREVWSPSVRTPTVSWETTDERGLG
jgi:hypothetical protein